MGRVTQGDKKQQTELQTSLTNNQHPIAHPPTHSSHAPDHPTRHLPVTPPECPSNTFTTNPVCRLIIQVPPPSVPKARWSATHLAYEKSSGGGSAREEERGWLCDPQEARKEKELHELNLKCENISDYRCTAENGLPPSTPSLPPVSLSLSRYHFKFLLHTYRSVPTRQDGICQTQRWASWFH